MKTIEHYNKENLFLYWNGKQQPVASNVHAIEDYITTSVNCFGAKLEQFEIRSTFSKYTAKEFLHIYSKL